MLAEQCRQLRRRRLGTDGDQVGRHDRGGIERLHAVPRRLEFGRTDEPREVGDAEVQ